MYEYYLGKQEQPIVINSKLNDSTILNIIRVLNFGNYFLLTLQPVTLYFNLKNA